MTPGFEVALSSALVFGIPMVFALREMMTTRPPPGGTQGNGPPPPNAPNPPPRKPDEDTDSPLPACLLPPYPPLPEDELDPLPEIERA